MLLKSHCRSKRCHAVDCAEPWNVRIDQGTSMLSAHRTVWLCGDHADRYLAEEMKLRQKYHAIEMHNEHGRQTSLSRSHHKKIRS